MSWSSLKSDLETNFFNLENRGFEQSSQFFESVNFM